MKKPTISDPFEIECSITAGIIKAQRLAEVEPIAKRYDNKVKVVYRIKGDIEKAFQEIYSNCPVGALDVLQAIKFTRSAIFALKGGQR